ncbi:MAG TPA: hypothetical protein VLT59_07045, partial [Steroidobacteraceae bacterium]|nr:hypothetical protein [Steroidobacteraceae bacterium]
MTLVLSSLPDLSERVARGRFADQLRGESAIVFGITREATSAAGEGPLSLRAALGGREEVLVGRSRLVVDDDVFLVLNRGTLHATRIRADEPVFSFAVYFCDALVAEVLAWGTGREDGLMEPGASAHASDPEPAVAENLRPHDRCLSPALRYLMLVCRERTCEQLWYDEQLHLLLERIL